MAYNQNSATGAQSAVNWLPPPMSQNSPQQSALSPKPHPPQWPDLACHPTTSFSQCPACHHICQHTAYAQQHHQQLYQHQKKLRVLEPPGWKWTKVVLHVLALLVSMAGFGLALSLSHKEILDLAAVACAPPLGIAMIWSASELVTQTHLKFRAGIHPGAHVGLSLLLWIASASCGGFTLSEYADSGTSSGIFGTYSMTDALTYERSAIMAAVLTIAVAVIHFVLFVGSCIDIAKRNTATNRPLIGADAPIGTAEEWQRMPPEQQQGLRREQEWYNPVELRIASPVLHEAPAGVN